MNDLEREVIQMQIDSLDELLKNDRPMTLYEFDIRKSDDKETTLSKSANEIIKMQNQLCTRHFSTVKFFKKTGCIFYYKLNFKK